MKLPDVNILLYASDEASSRYRHAAVLRELLVPLGVGGNLTTDAHLAALAIEHGAELVSCDADFSRFAGLRWRDPLR